MDNRTIPIVLAVIKNDNDQILIARRNDETLIDGHGKWELPGGRIEWNETIEQAVAREAQEETGLEIKVVRLLPKLYTNNWTYTDDKEFKALLIPYECQVIGGELHTTNFDEKISKLKFINLSDLDSYDFLSYTQEIIKLAFN